MLGGGDVGNSSLQEGDLSSEGSLEEFDKASFYHEGRGLNEETHGQGRSVVHEEHGFRIWLLNLPDGCCISVTIVV
jgi:hypothetical protein